METVQEAPVVVKASFAPMDTKIEALKLLEKGVKPEDLGAELKKSGAVEVAEKAVAQESSDNAEKKEAALYRDYLLSLIRYQTGRGIEKLSVAELEDVASHGPLPEVKFNEWCRRVGE